jgi:hypothetical protein
MIAQIALNLFGILSAVAAGVIVIKHPEVWS